MATDPSIVAQLQVGRDQVAAAWSAAHAAWAAAIATGSAALLTLGAIATAFVVQRLQAKSDRALQQEVRRATIETAVTAANDAAAFLSRLDADLDTRLLQMWPEPEIATAEQLLGVLDHILGRDVPSVVALGAMLVIRPALDATLVDLRGWRTFTTGQRGVDPTDLRTRLRQRLVNVRAAQVELAALSR